MVIFNYYRTERMELKFAWISVFGVCVCVCVCVCARARVGRCFHMSQGLRNIFREFYLVQE